MDGPWRWSSPPQWPPAPDGWRPSGTWLPDRTWPLPDPQWQWWQHAGDVADADLEAALPSHFPLKPDLSGIEIVWVPAPGWPQPPAGWHPPTGWKRPRGWPSAPRNWQHWQPDPAVIAARRQQWWTYLVGQCSKGLANVVWCEVTLDDLERTVLYAGVAARALQEVSPTEAQLGAVLASNDPARLAVDRALHAWVGQLGVRREFLLAAAGDANAGEQYAHLLLREQLYMTEFHIEGIDLFEAQFVACMVAVQRRYPRDAPPGVWRAEVSDRLRELSTWRTTRREAALAAVFGRGGAMSGRPDWEQAEELAADYLRSVGFVDAKVTGPGTDAGFDVTGRGLVGQVKYLATAVGRPDLQRLAGANQHGARMAFFSRSGYASTAVPFADMAGIALFTIELPGVVTPVNGLAQQMASGAFATW